jgi:hypothetical protein
MAAITPVQIRERYGAALPCAEQFSAEKRVVMMDDDDILVLRASRPRFKTAAALPSSISAGDR